MVFKTFNAGDVLTAGDLNNYLMSQSVIVCTSGTRPASPIEGMTVYETDTDRYVSYTNGSWSEMMTMGSWASYAPGWNGTVGNGTISARYTRLAGRLIVFTILLTWGSTTTAPGAQWQFSIPVAAARNFVGAASVFDSSAGRLWTGSFRALSSSSQIDRIFVDSAEGDTGNANRSWVLNSNTAPFAWASPDELAISGFYEAATG